LSDGPTRQAFLRTLRSVVDHRGQAVSALGKLNSRTDFPVMAVWGERDNMIPVKHAYAAQEVRPDVRLEVLADVGHFPHAERPAEVAALIDDFITSTERGYPAPTGRFETDEREPQANSASA
jgi:pimeloyl-ACP methyl ester carboxylesterase